MYEPPSRTSFRASGAVLPGRTVRDYQVGCVTPEGVRCTVVTDPQAMLPVYRVGDWTTADVEIFKPAGTFGWTFNSQLLAWPAAFAFALAAFQWRRRRDIPIAVPPAPTFAVAREELIGRRLLSIRGYQQANVEDLTPICGWRSKHSRSAVVRLKHWRKSKRLAMSRS
jgi:hypothetical protein